MLHHFKQKRYGKDEVPFTCYKFRTMKIDTPPNIPTRVMREDKAVMTPIGAMLRKTSIDELPQLVNIVKGDIPLRILKTRLEFSEKSMGAFALPAKSSTNKEKAFSQVASCFASGADVPHL
ncbi:sugar transferase [Ellagibacter isourolithinifaciens]|uniref:sugar transferase n=1 Tax=Ellagibacter isourolithinifaciens TaxID=2137581 RepID=UPI003A949D81